MTRKLFGRALALVVLTAGLVLLASQVSATHTGPAADEPIPAQAATAAKPTDDGNVDMNSWQRTALPSGSKYKPPGRGR